MLKFFKKKDKDKKSNNEIESQDNKNSVQENQIPVHSETKSEIAQSIQERKSVATATTLNHEDVDNRIEKEAQAAEKSTIHPSKPHQDTKQELDDKLEKSRNGFGKKMKHLFSFKKEIDEDLFEDIETTLLMADVGAKATMDIVDNTAKSVKRRKLMDSEAVYGALKTHLHDLAKTVEKPLIIDTKKTPFVILVVGVNGVGKTTTIAKIARNFKQQGKSVMLAAGDTFRAAAVEQLKTWGAREDIPVVAQTTGSDSASVIFDAMSSAKAKGVDILIADTAGRLHTQANLMQELGKIGRVMKKNDATAPHETLIVVDGGTGQNAISQIQEFNKTPK